MAHFIKMNENKCIGPVIVVNNNELLDENGIEQEELGVAFCKSLFGEETEWKQTSYNATFRKYYAGPGMNYDPELDEFTVPAPTGQLETP